MKVESLRNIRNVTPVGWQKLLLIAGLMLFGITGGMYLHHKKQHQGFRAPEIARQEKDFQQLSKAEITGQIVTLTKKVAALEAKSGYQGKAGYKIYAAPETEQLLRLYQAIDLRLHFLNDGNCNSFFPQWDGYDFERIKPRPYDISQANQVLSEVARHVPGNMIQHLKIFLMPVMVKNIGGLGGAGFIIVSAYPASESYHQASGELSVTLSHEIGHHIHMSFMPENTREGRELWRRFLRICGGKWHGPGQVNTKAWSDSSEETFAEYFRMLYGGPDQPFFGDVTLGDPRTHPGEAEKLARFISQLRLAKAARQDKSPWLPNDGLSFWQFQREFILGLWLILGAGATGLMMLQQKQQQKPLQPALRPTVTQNA